jgi:hypothetical protein
VKVQYIAFSGLNMAKNSILDDLELLCIPNNSKIKWGLK